MAFALLVSDNRTLNNLYTVNLNAYVAIDVKVIKDYKKAIEVVKTVNKFEVIICLDNMAHREELSELFNTIKAAEKPIPIILVGTKSEVSEDKFMTIPNQYSLKEIVRAVAKFLNVSAQDMAKKEVPKYFPIPVSFLSNVEESSCDIYYRSETAPFVFDYFKIITSEQKLEDNIQKLIDEGTDYLYVESKSRLNFINQTSSYILTELSKDNLSVEDKVKVLSHGFEFVGERILDHPQAIDEIKEISNVCIQAITSVIREVPKISSLLNTLLNSKGEYVYIHSILATYIAYHIIDRMEWGNKEQKEKVAFVLFFHDIFLVPVFKKFPHLHKEEDLLFSSELSENDKNIVLEHARMAGELVRSFKQIPIGADMIITQHHGATSGKGFAMSFKDDISPLSKVTLIAEEMAFHLFNLKKSGRPYKDNKNTILAELNEKFKYHTYQRMIKTLDDLEA